MTYGECCEKIRNGEKVTIRDITPIWILYLFQDRELKNIQIGNKLYEINFINSDVSIGVLFFANNNTCTKMSDAFKLIRNIISNIESGNRVTLCLDDEYFEIIVELLESE